MFEYYVEPLRNASVHKIINQRLTYLLTHLLTQFTFVAQIVD